MTLYPLHSGRPGSAIHLTDSPRPWRATGICGTPITDGTVPRYVGTDEPPTCQRCIEKAAKLQKREVSE